MWHDNIQMRFYVLGSESPASDSSPNSSPNTETDWQKIQPLVDFWRTDFGLLVGPKIAYRRMFRYHKNSRRSERRNDACLWELHFFLAYFIFHFLAYFDFYKGTSTSETPLLQIPSQQTAASTLHFSLLHLYYNFFHGA